MTSCNIRIILALTLSSVLDRVLEGVTLKVCGMLWWDTVKMNILSYRLGESWLESFSLDRDWCRNLVNTVSNKPYGLTGREFLNSLSNS